MRISRKPPRICDVPLVSSRVSPIQPPLRCKNASPDFSANFKLSLARLRILVKVLNGRQRVAFGQPRHGERGAQIRLGPCRIKARFCNAPPDLALARLQELLTRHCSCEGSHFHGDDPYSIAAVKRIAISSRKEAYSQSPDA